MVSRFASFECSQLPCRYDTVEEATEAKEHAGHVHVAVPKWVEVEAAAAAAAHADSL